MIKVGTGTIKAGKYKNVYDNKENKLEELEKLKAKERLRK
jgi:hypothetical protein